MEIGDMFCVSAKNPIWFSLKRAEFVAEKENNVKTELGFDNELAKSLENSSEMKDIGTLEPESIDISHIDPVKEFGFLVIGREFDSYPKKMIRDIKNWDWFIEEPRVDSEDDESEEKQNKTGRRKRKKDRENEDDEWAGESEEEKEQLTNTRKVQRPKYLTRSRDRHEPSKDMGKSGHSLQKKNSRSNVKRVDEEEEEDEEDDETLGGFIVDKDNVEEEEEIDKEEEEEEEEEFKDEADDEFDD